MYNVKRLGMPLEKESLPHYVFWTEFLPELVREVMSRHIRALVVAAHLPSGHHVHHSHRQGLVRRASPRPIRPIIARRVLAVSRRAGMLPSAARLLAAPPF